MLMTFPIFANTNDMNDLASVVVGVLFNTSAAADIHVRHLVAAFGFLQLPREPCHL